MTGDTPADAEAFLGKWRRAQRVMYREDLVNMPATEHMGLAAGMHQCVEQGLLDPQVVRNVENQFFVTTVLLFESS